MTSTRPRSGPHLGRQLAKNLSVKELEKITGGTTSCSAGEADDCDDIQI